MRTMILFLLVLALASCTTQQPRVKVIGHRGASSVAPENTLASFAKAVEFGADYFELDVWVSKDDSLIVIHDDSLQRTTNGEGAVADYTCEQLKKLDAGSWFDAKFAGEPLPTLKEALQLAKKNDIKVCIEIKSRKPGIVGDILNLVDKLGMADRVIIFSFDADQVAEAKKLRPDIPALYLVGEASNADVDKAVQLGADAIGIGDDATPELVDYAHQKGLELWKWTVNDIDDMLALIKMGADGIITNYPQKLVELLAQK